MNDAERTTLTRRQALLGGLGLAGAALLAGCAGGGSSFTAGNAAGLQNPSLDTADKSGAKSALQQEKRRRLEPAGSHLLHGAGQDAAAFAAYTQAVAPHKPLLYMTYAGLSSDPAKYFDALKTELQNYKDSLLVPQIGLSMTSDGHPEAHYEQDVAAGKYDANIEAFCRGLAGLNRPTFVRLGYEFNGPWNGYKPDTYKAAWARVAKAVRAHNLDDVALVWCFIPQGENKDKYLAYYPGDDLVDWWSVNTFQPAHFTDASTLAFLKDADSRKFPVMIGEATPQHVGVLDGAKSWDAWFKPYFDFLHAHPAIKAFCYINWDWAQYPQWHDWGDARLQQNRDVRERYRQELSDSRYVHAAPAQQVRQALGLLAPERKPALPKLAAS